jgi:hypothetical protein
MGSFEEYLRPITAYVPPALISPSAFSDINSVARVLPATLAHNMFFFECRLGERAPRADFSVLARSSCGRSSLSGLHPTSTLPARLMTDTVWRRVEDFAVHWADPSSLLYHAVDNVWLEFDVEGPPPDVPVPSIFFAPQSNGQMDDIEVAGEPNAEGRLATVERTIRLLAGGEPPPRMLERCFRALSSDEKVFLGLMLSRGEDAVRLCIRLRSVERIMEYLRVVAWPGDEADLRGVLEPLARSVDRMVLAIDVGDAVRPNIGLECGFDGNRQPGSEPRWGAFLDSLVQNGLCTSDKREALLAYPGYVDEATSDMPWPAALRQASQLLGGRSLSTFVRWLHHVKIVYRPGEQLEAKAYLAGNHHWHTPASNT